MGDGLMPRNEYGMPRKIWAFHGWSTPFARFVGSSKRYCESGGSGSMPYRVGLPKSEVSNFALYTDASMVHGSRVTGLRSLRYAGGLLCGDGSQPFSRYWSSS